MGEVEIIPPRRASLPARPTSAPVAMSPRVNPGGIVSSTLTRWHANSQNRALTAMAGRTRAEADLYEAQSQAIESYVKRDRAAARLQELPEMIAADRAKRRAARAEELRELYHQHELASVRRMTELTRAEVVLEDARQALKAQRDHGYGVYELEWQRRQCESLDVELSAEERREVLRQHQAEVKARKNRGSPQDKNDQGINDALYEARAQLRASGLDTTRIDALLNQRSGTK